MAVGRPIGGRATERRGSPRPRGVPYPPRLVAATVSLAVKPASGSFKPSGGGARTPVSFFDAAYEGTPPWDIGRPQAEFVRLAESGEIRGKVLDVGCGTGEHSLFLAARGLEVRGVDSAARAIKKAKSKASGRRLTVRFDVEDALHLERLGVKFDTIIDSGLFHVFDDKERPKFTASLAEVLRPGGTYFMMCFSEHEPNWGGPRRVTQAEIRASFGRGWRVNWIREARFETNGDAGHAKAWLSSITRT